MTTTDHTTTDAATYGRPPRTMFAVVANDAGYLPDADPIYCPTAADAIATMCDEIHDDAHHAADAADDDHDADAIVAPFFDAADTIAAVADAIAADLAAWHATGVAAVGIVVRTITGADRGYSVHAVAHDHDGAACCPAVLDGRGHDGAPWACE